MTDRTSGNTKPRKRKADGKQKGNHVKLQLVKVLIERFG